MNRPVPITLTPAAQDRVRRLIAARGCETVGIRIGIRSKGCSGLSYNIEFADAIQPMDDVFPMEGFTLLIDPKALMFLLGTEMDYIEGKIESGFTFRNPNEKGRCGCGESFHL